MIRRLVAQVWFVLILLPVLLNLAGAAGLWTARTIYLPDSLVGLFSPSCFAYNAEENTVIGCGYGDMILFSAEGARLVKIPTPVQIFYKEVISVLHVPGWNKFYVAYSPYWLTHNGYLVVVDGVTHQVRKVLSDLVRCSSRAMCYSNRSNKVYVAGKDSLMVIDVATDSIIAYPHASPGSIRDVCYNQYGNKVYCANWAADRVAVVDVASDSVITEIPVSPKPSLLCYNPADNKVYCAHSDSTVTVIDGNRDTVIAVISVRSPTRSIAWNPATDEVYVGVSDWMNTGLAVISGTGDTMLTFIATRYDPTNICVSARENKVLFAGSVPRDNAIGIVDGASHTIVALLNPGTAIAELCTADSGRTVLAAANYSGEVITVDLRTDSIVRRELVGFRPMGISLNASRRKLYCSGRDVPFLFAIDIRGDSVLRRLDLGAVREYWIGEFALVCDPVQDKLYVGREDSLLVFACATDSVHARLDTRWLEAEGLPRLWLVTTSRSPSLIRLAIAQPNPRTLRCRRVNSAIPARIRRPMSLKTSSPCSFVITRGAPPSLSSSPHGEAPLSLSSSPIAGEDLSLFLPPPSRGRIEVGGIPARRSDHFQHTLHIRQYIVIPEPQDIPCTADHAQHRTYPTLTLPREMGRV
ncbi:MAG: YncE family protein [candidate division WOR-3 bacterium]